MTVIHAPGDPGWSPDRIRNPDPTATFVHVPTAIMKSGPAPGVIRLPIPAGIGVNPVTAVTVRSPIPNRHYCARLPTPTETIHLHPATVRGKIVVKVIYLRGRIADINRVRRRGS